MKASVLVGAAVWLASNKTGRRTAATCYKILSKMGNYAVGRMPRSASNFFSGAESLIKNAVSEDGERKESD